MSIQENSKALLPSGFTDLLPPDAQQEAEAIHKLMKVFSAFGYERIKPPLVEFEESLLAPGPGAALAGETFRLMDPVSHKMMGVRSDMTPQTARVAISRLGKEPRPLRLAYAGDVLRTRAGHRRIERQFGQAGCELIGVNTSEADIEVCVVALKALHALKLKNASIDLCAPRLLDKIMDAHKVAEKDRAEIRACVDRKDLSALEGREKWKKTLSSLIMAAGAAKKTRKELKDIDLPETAKRDIAHLLEVGHALEKAIKALDLEGVRVTMDPLENKGFEYQSGIGFTLFAPGVRGELGRGGRYGIYADGVECETAAGFTLYMDTVRMGMPPSKKAQRVFVPAKTGWEEIASLQKEGWTVLRETGQDDRACCKYEYKNGKVQEIQ